MNYNEILVFLKEGKIGKLPNYEGNFYYSPGLDRVYMKNGNDFKLNLLDEKKRSDWYF